MTVHDNVLLSQQVPDSVETQASGNLDQSETTRPLVKMPKAWNARTLLSTPFPEPNWVIPQIIPEGLTIVAGRPKVGKSWLALQIANAVCIGGTVLGIQVEKRRVAYLALEDNERRLKERLITQEIDFGDDKNLIFYLSWEKLQDRGQEQIKYLITDVKAEVIIVDTLSRIVGNADQNKHSDMSNILGPLHRLAHEHHVSIILIDHYRKVNRDDTSDPVEAILGSTAKVATVDAVLGMKKKKKNSPNATLNVTGRDVAENEITIIFRPKVGKWYLEDGSEEKKQPTNRDKVLEVIQQMEAENEVPYTTNIASRMNTDQGNVSRWLGELEAQGLVVKTAKQGPIQPYHTREYVNKVPN